MARGPGRDSVAVLVCCPVSVALPTRRRCPESRIRPSGLSETRTSVRNRWPGGLFENGVSGEDDLLVGAGRPDPDDESTVRHAITCLSVLSCGPRRACSLVLQQRAVMLPGVAA